MIVVAQEDEGVDVHRIAPHRAGENAPAEFRDPSVRLEQKSTLKGPGGDLDEAVGGEKAQSATHTE